LGGGLRKVGAGGGVTWEKLIRKTPGVWGCRLCRGHPFDEGKALGEFGFGLPGGGGGNQEPQKGGRPLGSGLLRGNGEPVGKRGVEGKSQQKQGRGKRGGRNTDDPPGGVGGKTATRKNPSGENSQEKTRMKLKCFLVKKKKTKGNRGGNCWQGKERKIGQPTPKGKETTKEKMVESLKKRCLGVGGWEGGKKMEQPFATKEHRQGQESLVAGSQGEEEI